MPYKNKEDQRAAWRRHYANHKDRYLTKARAHRAEMKRRVVAYKMEKGCKICGEDHPACLSFHHRDKGEKSFDIRSGIQSRKTWKALLVEIEKCDVLCENCHRKVHWSDSNPTAPAGLVAQR